jgi:hypothetical protein
VNGGASDTAEGGAEPPKALDFNDTPRKLVAALSFRTNETLRRALAIADGAAKSNPTHTLRQAAIAALEAARDVLGENRATRALGSVLEAAAIELRDLEAGCRPGPITAPAKVSGRPPDGEAVILPRARAVLAVEWLEHAGKRPSEAASLVASAIAIDARQVAQWADEFHRPRAARQATMLAALWYAVEVEGGGWSSTVRDGTDRHGTSRPIADASPEEILAWLKSGPIPAGRAGRKPKRSADHAEPDRHAEA